MPGSNSPSTPSRPPSIHPTTPRTRTHAKASSQIYVLSADGSRLFLLDPSAPSRGEEPPAYHTIQSPSTGSAALPSPNPQDGDSYDPAWEIGVEDDVVNGPGGGPSSPRSVRIQELPPIRSLSSASLMIPSTPGRRGGGRDRAYTTSSEPGGRMRRAASDSGSPRTERRADSRREGVTRPQSLAPATSDEQTPLLGVAQEGRRRRGMMRSIFCGDLESEDEAGTWGAGWRRFWRPVVRAEYWRSVLHLLVLNFPFALLIWPFLFAGTVAGTALLITLPIGAAVWWLTLILARTAARLEIMMQNHHHGPLPIHSQPVYHPIFHRLVDAPSLTPHTSPRSRSRATSQLASPHLENTREMVWETGFIKCSYAMFCDYYSYSALSYFVLLKPLITLFSTIALIVLGAVGLATVLGIPVYLRAARRWGRWQAGFAVDNL